MVILSKRRKLMVKEKIFDYKIYSFDKAIEFIKKFKSINFIESIDISINLGIDTNKPEQHIKGVVVLPYGTGRKIKVIVFVKDISAHSVLLHQSGADFIGMEDLVKKVENGFKDFDLVVSTPEAMPMVSTLGPILGPRGLMPNPKFGTVTNDIIKTVKNFKSGQIRFYNDKNGIIHSIIGNTNFSSSQLKENLKVFLLNLIKLKPVSSKGLYIKKVTISSTMGFGYLIKHNDLLY